MYLYRQRLLLYGLYSSWLCCWKVRRHPKFWLCPLSYILYCHGYAAEAIRSGVIYSQQ